MEERGSSQRGLGWVILSCLLGAGVTLAGLSIFALDDVPFFEQNSGTKKASEQEEVVSETPAPETTTTIPEPSASVEDSFSEEEISRQYGEVGIEGVALPPLDLPGSFYADERDEAFGKKAPTLLGTDFDDEEIRIEPDGRIKAIYFVTHWCPFCQEEVPVVQGILDEGLKPENLDVYTVSTLVGRRPSNFPPQDWLEEEGWSPVVIRDDEDSSAFAAFGGSGTPYVVYLDGENTVIGRSSGLLEREETVRIWNMLTG